MNNLTNMPGMPMGGQQQQRPPFAMHLQNQAVTMNTNPGATDYSWQANISREARDNVVKNLYLTFFIQIANIMKEKLTLSVTSLPTPGY